MVGGEVRAGDEWLIYPEVTYAFLLGDPARTDIYIYIYIVCHFWYDTPAYFK